MASYSHCALDADSHYPGSVPFLLREHLSYSQLAIFSLASYPYSLKLFWSPIVDSKFFPNIGRRKSWIIPMQMIIGTIMFIMSFKAEEYVNDVCPFQFLPRNSYWKDSFDNSQRTIFICYPLRLPLWWHSLLHKVWNIRVDYKAVLIIFPPRYRGRWFVQLTSFSRDMYSSFKRLGSHTPLWGKFVLRLHLSDHRVEHRVLRFLYCLPRFK